MKTLDKTMNGPKRRNPPPQDSDRKHLTGREVERLIEATRGSRNEARDRCLLLLMFRHGLRVSEAVGLKLDQVDTESRMLHVARLKGGLSTTHPLRGDELRAISAWLKERARLKPTGKVFFVSEQRKPLHRSTVNLLLRKFSGAASLPFLAHPHMLRHACGFALADQGADTRLAALKKAGCKTIFKDEGISGATTKRPSLLRCLKTLQEGDTLIVWKLDRLGRSLRDLIAMLDELRSRGVKFHSLTEHIDTETPTGRAMWQMIGVLAELERSMITERTRAGVKAAQRRGVKFGRKPKMTRQQVAHARKLIEAGEDRAKVAALFKVGRKTLYRALNAGGWPRSEIRHKAVARHLDFQIRVSAAPPLSSKQPFACQALSNSPR